MKKKLRATWNRDIIVVRDLLLPLLVVAWMMDATTSSIQLYRHRDLPGTTSCACSQHNRYTNWPTDTARTFLPTNVPLHNISHRPRLAEVEPTTQMTTSDSPSSRVRQPSFSSPFTVTESPYSLSIVSPEVHVELSARGSAG